jgi:hypothetical protein
MTLMPKAEVAAIVCALPPKDRAIYAAIAAAARAGRPCPTADDLVEVSGYAAVSSTVDAVHRIERSGVIVVERWQRSRRVMLADTGEWTALPLNRAPHWRERPRDAALPLPSLAVVATKQIGLAHDVRQWAASRGVSLADALADLVYVGWKVEVERG